MWPWTPNEGKETNAFGSFPHILSDVFPSTWVREEKHKHACKGAREKATPMENVGPHIWETPSEDDFAEITAFRTQDVVAVSIHRNECMLFNPVDSGNILASAEDEANSVVTGGQACQVRTGGYSLLLHKRVQFGFDLHVAHLQQYPASKQTTYMRHQHAGVAIVQRTSFKAFTVTCSRASQCVLENMIKLERYPLLLLLLQL